MSENKDRDEKGRFVKKHKQSNSGKTHFKKGEKINLGKHWVVSKKGRINMSNAHKGKRGYWKGKTRSKETKEKMSDKLKGREPWNKGLKGFGNFISSSPDKDKVVLRGMESAIRNWDVKVKFSKIEKDKIDISSGRLGLRPSQYLRVVGIQGSLIPEIRKRLQEIKERLVKCREDILT